MKITHISQNIQYLRSLGVPESNAQTVLQLLLQQPKEKRKYLLQQIKQNPSTPPDQIQSLTNSSTDQQDSVLQWATKISPQDKNWLVKMVQTNQAVIGEDDQKLKNLLESYHSLSEEEKKQNPLHEQTPSSLFQLLSDSNTQKETIYYFPSEKHAHTIYDKDGIQIVEITSTDEATFAANGTNWCVKDPTIAESYIRGPLDSYGRRDLDMSGPLYLVLKNYKKIALLHPFSGQAKDIYDLPIKNYTLIKEIFPAIQFLNENKHDEFRILQDELLEMKKIYDRGEKINPAFTKELQKNPNKLPEKIIIKETISPHSQNEQDLYFIPADYAKYLDPKLVPPKIRPLLGESIRQHIEYNWKNLSQEEQFSNKLTTKLNLEDYPEWTLRLPNLYQYLYQTFQNVLETCQTPFSFFKNIPRIFKTDQKLYSVVIQRAIQYTQNVDPGPDFSNREFINPQLLKNQAVMSAVTQLICRIAKSIVEKVSYSTNIQQLYRIRTNTSHMLNYYFPNIHEIYESPEIIPALNIALSPYANNPQVQDFFSNSVFPNNKPCLGSLIQRAINSQEKQNTKSTPQFPKISSKKHHHYQAHHPEFKFDYPPAKPPKPSPEPPRTPGRIPLRYKQAPGTHYFRHPPIEWLIADWACCSQAEPDPQGRPGLFCRFHGYTPPPQKPTETNTNQQNNPNKKISLQNHEFNITIIGTHQNTTPTNQENSKNEEQHPVVRLANEMMNRGYRFELPRKQTNPNQCIQIAGDIYPTLISPDGAVKIALDSTDIFLHNNNVYQGDPSQWNTDQVTIAALVTNPLKRHQGLASKTMQELHDAADKLGMTLIGEPIQMKEYVSNQPALSTEQLKDWYQRQGWTPRFPKSRQILWRKPKHL